MFGKKRRKVHIEEIFPCEKTNCRYYTEWLQAKDARALYIKKTSPDYWTWESSLGYCVTCKHFKQFDNFIEKKDAI